MTGTPEGAHDHTAHVPTWVHGVVLVLFFVSGACGLVYEVLWARMLTLSFGVTVLAVSTVISAFMAGMALGSYLFGRWADRVRKKLWLFALLQAGIGLYALVFPFLLRTAEALFAPLYHMQLPPAVFHLSRFLVSVLLLIVPTTLMGGTLPVLVRGVSKHLRGIGWRVGLLYGTNTAGAMVGCALTGFWMAAVLGTSLSVRLAASANLMVALVSWCLSWKYEAREAPGAGAGRKEPTGERPLQVEEDTGPYSSRLVRLVIVAAGVSGFCALSYELLWFRVLSVILQDYSTYSFAAMLTTYLAALAVGSWLWGWLLRHIGRPLLTLGVIEVIIGVLGLLSMAYLWALQRWYFANEPSFPWQSPALTMLVVSAAALFVPVSFMGGALPVASAVVSRRLRTLGRSIGTLYAGSTLGAIAGAFIPVFVLIPLVGTQWAVFFTGFANVAIGAVLIAATPGAVEVARAALLATPAAAAVVAVVLVPTNSYRMFFRSFVPLEKAKLLFFRDGVTGTVTVHDTANWNKTLSINALAEVPTDYGAMRTFRVMGHLPMVLHPDPQRALSITFGGGIVAGAMSRHRPKVLDVVDVCAGVFDAAELLATQNQHVLDYPDLRIFVNDARNFVAHASETYDVIISDCTHPKSGDSWVLFTREFYRDVRRRLSPDGVFAQFILIHRLRYPEFLSLLATIQETFPESSVWIAGPYVLVVSRLRPFEIDYQRVRQALEQPSVAASLAPYGMDRPEALLGNFCLGPEAMRVLTRDSYINTEDQPFVGLTHMWVRRTTPVTLRHLFARAGPVSRYVTGLPSEEDEARAVRDRLDRFSISHPHAVWAEWEFSGKNLVVTLEWTTRALAANPHDPDALYYRDRALSGLQEQARLARRRLKEHPEEASSYYRLARAQARGGAPEAAVESLKKALELGMDPASVHEELAALYQSLGRASAAVAQWERALALRPDSVRLRVSLARALWQQGRMRQAEKLLGEALEADPGHVAAHETLGSILQSRGELDEARRLFEDMLEADPYLASPYIHLARIYEQQKLLGKAVDNYVAALANDPYQLAAYLGGIRVLAAEGDWPGVKLWAERGRRFLPNSAELTAILGDLAMSRGDLDEAEKLYREAVSFNPDLPVVHAALARIATTRGDKPTAVRHWREVLRREPRNVEASRSLEALSPQGGGSPGALLPPG